MIIPHIEIHRDLVIAPIAAKTMDPKKCGNIVLFPFCGGGGHFTSKITTGRYSIPPHDW
jgi:hypothetical protein